MNHSPQGSKNPQTVPIVLSRCVGLILALATVWLVYDRPVARIEVAAVLVACVLAQLRWADAWLIFVPALLPIFDLTLWSGRLYVNEFDLLVLATSAVHFLHAPGRHPFPRFTGRGGAVIGVLLFCFGVATLIGALPLPSPDANQLGSYLSNYNALRVAKSLFAALLLLAPLQASLVRDRAQTGTLLIVGTSIGLGLVGVTVLWERGVLLSVVRSGGHLYADRYAILQALLDFTSEYRVTALFSELHTGGEAIDTYLALAPPIAAAGVLGLRHPALRVCCFAALCLGTYAVVATFSRGLYLGFAGGVVTVFVFVTLDGRTRPEARAVGLRAIASMVVALAALFAAYTHGGFNALVTGLALSAASLIAAHLLSVHSRWIAAGVLGALAIGGSIALWNAFLASRYSTIGENEAWRFAAVCSVAVTFAGALMGGRGISTENRGKAAIVFLLFAGVAGIAIPATGGYRMIERFSESSVDARGRWEHWAEAYRLMGSDWTHYVFGVGLGRFPQLYFRRGTESEGGAGYRFGSDASGTWLVLGAGQYPMTQKVPLRPATRYTLSLSVRASNPDLRFDVGFCPKLILFSNRYNPECQDFMFETVAGGAWSSSEISFDSGVLGADGLSGLPITMMLFNGAEDSVIEVTGIRLDEGGHDIVANGNFAAGADRWIMISDWEHLPWHIKNLYLEVFFETGAIGLSIFLSGFGIALINAIRAARRQEALGVGVAGSLVAFALVGVVGSLLDNPRPATLFFIFLFWALQPRRRMRGQRDSHSGRTSASTSIALS